MVRTVCVSPDAVWSLSSDATICMDRLGFSSGLTVLDLVQLQRQKPSNTFQHGYFERHGWINRFFSPKNTSKSSHEGNDRPMYWPGIETMELRDTGLCYSADLLHAQGNAVYNTIWDRENPRKHKRSSLRCLVLTDNTFSYPVTFWMDLTRDFNLPSVICYYCVKLILDQMSRIYPLGLLHIIKPVWSLLIGDEVIDRC